MDAEFYTQTAADMGQNATTAMRVTLAALVGDGLLDRDAADQWCLEHSIIAVKPKWGFFRRLFADRYGDSDKLTMMVVTAPAAKEPTL